MIFIDLPMPDRCETCPCSFMQDGGVQDEDYCQVTMEVIRANQSGRPEWCPLKEEPKEEPKKVTCVTCRHLRTELIQRRNIPDSICAAPIWKELGRAPHVIGHNTHEPIRCDHWEPKEEGKA